MHQSKQRLGNILLLFVQLLTSFTLSPFRKDYETNKLVSGLLQLAPHTHLMLDETRMQQGKLEANGVHAIQHLAHLINNQQLKCDFQYYHIDYNVDIPVLIFSEGRSMLPVGVMSYSLKYSLLIQLIAE